MKKHLAIGALLALFAHAVFAQGVFSGDGATYAQAMHAAMRASTAPGVTNLYGRPYAEKGDPICLQSSASGRWQCGVALLFDSRYGGFIWPFASTAMNHDSACEYAKSHS